MTLKEIRRAILIAVFSDDVLMDLLVLKGGNALELIHGIGERASVDLDFSMSEEFDDVEEAQRRLFNALAREFSSRGYVVFDEKFEEKPPELRDGQPLWWGGYQAKFKIIRREAYDEVGGDLETIRRRSEVTDPLQRRTFKIDISKYEFCDGKVETEVDEYTVYVYSLEMLAIEKVRAICQQMPGYPHIGENLKRARARDFYDISEIVTRRKVDLGADHNVEMMRSIFRAKDVPLSLIGEIESQREFHRADWPAVEASVRHPIESFDAYFDRVVEMLRPLEALWKE